MFAALSSPVAGLIAAAATIASATIPPLLSHPVDQMNVDVMSCHAAACGRRCEGVPVKKNTLQCFEATRDAYFNGVPESVIGMHERLHVLAFVCVTARV